MAFFTVWRGDTKRFATTVKVDGQPYDVTGKLLLFTLKRRLSDPDSEAVMQLSSADGRFEVDGADVSWVITPADWQAKYPGPMPKAVTLFWDVQLVESQEVVHTIDGGEIRLRPDVTIGTGS